MAPAGGFPISHDDYKSKNISGIIDIPHRAIVCLATNSLRAERRGDMGKKGEE